MNGLGNPACGWDPLEVASIDSGQLKAIMALLAAVNLDVDKLHRLCHTSSYALDIPRSSPGTCVNSFPCTMGPEVAREMNLQVRAADVGGSRWRIW